MRSCEAGSSLLWAVAALALLAAVGAALSRISSSAGEQPLIMIQHQRAQYAAESGLNYARGQTAAGLADLHGGAKSTSMAMGDSQFTLTVAAQNADGTYPVAVLGTAGAGTAMEANFWIASRNVTPLPETTTPTPGTGSNITTTDTFQNVESQAQVAGDMSAAGFMLKYQSVVTGDLASSSWVSVEDSAKLTGNLCTTTGDLTVKSNGKITGDVSIDGSVTLESGATIDGNVQATGRLTLKSGAKVTKDVKLPLGVSGVTNSGGSIGGTVSVLTSLASCNVADAPNPARVTGATTALVLESGQTATLTGGTTYTYTSVQPKNGATLYLDVSNKKPLTIKASGDVNIEQGSQVLIKTANSGGYKTVDQLYAAGDTDAARLIYLDSDGTVTVKYQQSFFGTIYGRTAINLEQAVHVVGAYASPNTIAVKYQVKLLQYVLADQAW